MSHGPTQVGAVLFAGMVAGAAAFSTLQAQQAAATFHSLQLVLQVTDIDRSAEFYRTVLEFEPANVLPTVRTLLVAPANALRTAPDQAMFSVGGQSLVLRQGLKEGPSTDCSGAAAATGPAVTTNVHSVARARTYPEC